MIKDKYLKANNFAEKSIIESIVKQIYKPGDTLPPERELAEQLGITRPTLRETLQRLAREGWIKITHGRPTIINNITECGGMGALRTIANYPELIPDNVIQDWMEFRRMLMPEIAARAVELSKETIHEKLKSLPTKTDNNAAYAIFDWEFQMLLVVESKNIVSRMIFNDIKDSYHLYISKYFGKPARREASRKYYTAFLENLDKDTDTIKEIVKTAMNESIGLWQQ